MPVSPRDALEGHVSGEGSATLTPPSGGRCVLYRGGAIGDTIGDEGLKPSINTASFFWFLSVVVV